MPVKDAMGGSASASHLNLKDTVSQRRGSPYSQRKSPEKTRMRSDSVGSVSNHTSHHQVSGTLESGTAGLNEAELKRLVIISLSVYCSTNTCGGVECVFCVVVECVCLCNCPPGTVFKFFTHL